MSYFERPMEIELIRQMAREGMDRNKPASRKTDFSQYDCSDDLFFVRKANEWFTSEGQAERPKMLFDNFWFENELCILFADTNVGKSILAVQLGNNIANGTSIGNYRMELPASAVVYFDFEQSVAQFEARYTGGHHTFKFSDQFFRAELNAAAGDVKNYLDRVRNCMEETIKKTKAKVLIVDNLTYLANEAERARDALVMMKFLKMLKSKYRISILALAHTPKRNPAKPITNNDMQGSKMLVNFCDSAFAIGRSVLYPEMRYIKQIKQRNATEQYGENRVCLFNIERNNGDLYFWPVGHDTERAHLTHRSAALNEDIQLKIIELNRQGQSNRRIAAMLDVAHSTVARVLLKRVGE